MSTAIDTISGYVYGAEDSFSSVLGDRSLNFEREAGFAIQTLTANDYATHVTRLLLLTPRRKRKLRDGLTDLLVALAKTDPGAVARVLRALEDARDNP